MNRIFRNTLFYLLIFLVVIGVVGLFRGQGDAQQELNVNEFYDKLNNGDIEEMTIQPVNGVFRVSGQLEGAAEGEGSFTANIPANDEVISNITQTAQEQSVLNVEEEEQPSAWVTFLTSIIPFIIIFILFFFLLNQAQGGGSRVMNFGKSKAKMYSEEKKKYDLKTLPEQMKRSRSL